MKTAQKSTNSGKQKSIYLLAYASKIRPDLALDPVKLNATTTHILGQANKNNTGKELTGVLYYGQDHFFQCIEGPESTVQELFQIIKNDDRHKQVKLMATTHIDHRYFSTWCMKFVDNHHEINDFFKQQGLRSFKPEDLNRKQLTHFLKVLKNI